MLAMHRVADASAHPLHPHGYTLLEMLITVLLVAILSAVAVATYIKTAERARDREAQTMLKLIRNGEQRYLVKFNTYFPADGVTESDIADINTALDLQIDPEVRWDYSIVGVAGDFQASAARLNPPTGYSRTWQITENTQNF